MGRRFFKFACKTIRIFSRPMKTVWEVPFEEGPCVFIPNHVGALGPVDMCAKFPLRDKCYSWTNHGMMNRKEVPAYVRQDYWWKPGCFAEPLLNATIPYIAAAIIPPILNSAPTVPVYHDQRVIMTMRQSLRLLEEEKYLIIFPEQPSGWESHHTWINTGWLQLAPLWYRKCGRTLRMHPVHIDTKKHEFRVAAPVIYDPSRKLEEQTQEISEKLAKGLRGE